ncbi:MAG: GWxTD domain-containing protein [Chloroherpetonaceae bacterium]|nr:GWxTD domain-containing protein [Chloroherpetonaceae bacterium]MDW8438294.1 GWxTD domain-containing protein [Chloroherpetonaceae bacterium]
MTTSSERAIFKLDCRVSRWRPTIDVLKRCCLLLLFGASGALAKAQPLNLAESVDFATFKADSGQTLIEFYVAFQKSRLPYQVSGELASLELHLSLSAKEKGRDVKVETVKLVASEKSATRNEGLLVGRIATILPPSVYDFALSATSADGDLIGKGEFKRIKLRSFESDSLRVSDIMLAFNVFKSDNPKSPFYKNSFEAIPNPTGIYGEGAKELAVYIEIYNLVRNLRLNSDSLYSRTYLSRGDLVLEETERRKVRRRTADAIVYVEKTPIDSLLSGKYDYHFEISDSSFKPIIRRSKSFFVYNPNIKPEMLAERHLDALAMEFAGMTEELLDEMRQHVEYIITGDEKETYKSAKTLEQKRGFFERFWATRGGASARRAYMNKIEEANRRFSHGSTPGFKTDKGRVFIKYGEPQNIERENSSSNQKPYEIWQYENVPAQGNVIFIFADRMGFGRYELIHSTAIGEPHNPNWQQIVNQANSRLNDGGF